MKQNKNIILVVAALCLGSGAFAQQEKKTTEACETCGTGPGEAIAVFNYINDAQRYCVVSGCVPGSDVELYSSPSGGEVVATTIANERGEAIFKLSPETAVSFALNHNRVNEKGIAGNGHIMVLTQAAIQVENAAVNAVSDEVILSWRAAAATPGDWTFIVQKSSDNINFTDVAAVAARDGNAMQGYSYSCKKEDDIAVQYFRVEARDKTGAKVAVAADIVKGNVKSFFTVQPTLFEGSLQLTTAQDKLPAAYTISDAMGRTKYASGVITAMRQTLNLNLLSGTYILRVTDRKGVSSSQKIIRR